MNVILYILKCNAQTFTAQTHIVLFEKIYNSFKIQNQKLNPPERTFCKYVTSFTTSTYICIQLRCKFNKYITSELKMYLNNIVN